MSGDRRWVIGAGEVVAVPLLPDVQPLTPITWHPLPTPDTHPPSPNTQDLCQATGHDPLLALLECLRVDVNAGAAAGDGDRRLAVSQRLDDVVYPEAENRRIERDQRARVRLAGLAREVAARAHARLLSIELLDKHLDDVFVALHDRLVVLAQVPLDRRENPSQLFLADLHRSADVLDRIGVDVDPLDDGLAPQDE